MCKNPEASTFSGAGDGLPSFTKGGCISTKQHRVPRLRLQWHLANAFAKNNLSFGPVARGCQWESQKHMQPFPRQGETALMKTMDRHYREGLSAVWPGLPPPVLTQLKKDGLGDGSKARWGGRTWT